MMRRYKKISGLFTGNDHIRSQERADIVIVGNGIAGLTAALEARRLAPEKSIAIVSEQSHPTLNTPALKQFAFGKLAQEQLLAYAAGTERAQQSRRAGARVLTETEVVGIPGRVGSVAGVITSHRQTLPCQIVLVCTGTAPVTTLAECCDIPLRHKRGIIVDDHLRTSVNDIYAAGDAAALWNPRTKAHEPRAQWHAAVTQGRVAATVMTGYPELAASFGVPWHMTRLGALSLLTVGDPLHELDGATTLIDRKRRGYRIVSMRDERLVGYLSLGITQPDGLAIKRIVDEELPIRDVAGALLTGEFDAHQYFARHHARSAHRMAVTGKFAMPDTPRPLVQPTPETETGRTTEPLELTHACDDGSWKITGDVANSTHAPLSKARLDILDMLHKHDRPMKPKEIASALGKRDESIRRMLYKMKASGLIEETGQGYRALVPGYEQARPAGNGYDTGYARDRNNEGNDVEQEHPHNITLFQRPVPRVKRGARAINTHMEQMEDLHALSVSNSQPLILERG